MNAKLWTVAILVAGMSLTNVPVFAAANDFIFEPVTAELKKGDDVIVVVRLLHKPTGKPVSDALIIRKRVDMEPEGMADMESPVSATSASESGTYAFKTDLPMAGRYQLSLAAKVRGESETVIGKIVIKATK